MVMACIEWVFRYNVSETLFGLQTNFLGNQRVVCMENHENGFHSLSAFSTPDKAEEELLSLASHLTLERL